MAKFSHLDDIEGSAGKGILMRWYILMAAIIVIKSLENSSSRYIYYTLYASYIETRERTVY